MNSTPKNSIRYSTAKHKKLKKCMLYARIAMRNKVLFDQYIEGLKPGELPFNKAFADAYYPPRITGIDLDNYRGCKRRQDPD